MKNNNLVHEIPDNAFVQNGSVKIEKIRKRQREGEAARFEPWDAKKIAIAVLAAFDETKELVDGSAVSAATAIAGLVQSRLQAAGNVAPSVEEVQKLVVSTLTGLYPKTGKSYSEFMKKAENRRNPKSLLDASVLTNNYIGKADWRVKENSTVTYTIGGLILSNSGAVTANYWLNDIYDEETADAHRNCDVHIHDLSMLSGYCAGWSIEQLIKEGVGGVEGRITSGPAKHLSSLCNHMVNFLGIMQNEWAGAQAFSSFDTFLAPFVKADGLPYESYDTEIDGHKVRVQGVKQCIQEFIFGVNTPSRWGTQAPFTNITIDWTVPDEFKNRKAIVGGKELDFTYGECQHEMDMVNRAFLEIMAEGDYNGRGFQYPIPTYSITKDFDWNPEDPYRRKNLELLFEMTSKYGTPYFSNYVNSDMKPSDIRSMCCRLRLDLRELRKKSGGFFGSGENTGSIGVVTINLARLGYLAESKEDFFVRLDHIMDLSARSLHIKRRVITDLLEKGLYPYTKKYLGTFNNHFSTIGVCGGNEMCLNAKWLKCDMRDIKAQFFAEEVLNHMRKRLLGYQQQYGDLYNLEATPAESTCYRFAKKDKEFYPDIITAENGEGTPYYTNSTNLPVDYTDDVFDALDVQDRLQPLYTSGTVFHTFLGEKLPTWESSAKLVRTICENYRLPYITISPTYSICPEHGYLDGEVKVCPKCGKPTEVWSRITGYYRPIKNWNEGKAAEYDNRKEYVVKYSRKAAESESVQTEMPVAEVAGYQRDFEIPEGITLLVRDNCPKCERVESVLDGKGVGYTVLNAEKDELGRKIAERFDVMAAPFLIQPDGTLTRNFDDVLAYAEGA